MKRIDLKDGETAFFYNGDPTKPAPNMTPEQMQKGGEIVADITGPPLKTAAWMMSIAAGEPIDGVMILMNKEGRMCGLTATAESTENVIKALEQALERMREARMKEAS